MNSEIKTISRRIRQDIRTLKILTGIYCRDHHRSAPASPASADLCSECEQFLAYAADRLSRCPLTPKPACRDCHIHCFTKTHRETVRSIMRYGWPRIIRRGRIDLLWRLLAANWNDRKKERS